MSTMIQQITLDRLLPHPDNPNRMSRANFTRLVRNIERTGYYEPLVVRPHPDRTGRFQIINGQRRHEALKKLGHETADAVVWNVDDEQTAVLLATLNRLGGRDSLDRKLTLLRRLRRRMPIPVLAQVLPQTRSQLERLLARKPLRAAQIHAESPAAVPLVFFVDEAQRCKIEEAISLAEPGNPKARAAHRAAALTCLAQSFVKQTREESGR
jgi:ParB-like chromosome segregation protein Spo0J